MQTVILKIKGMSCDHCKGAVEGILREVPGVASAVVNLAVGEAVVEMSTQVRHEDLVAAVDEVGYEVVD